MTSDELAQAEARLGSAEAYVLDRYGVKGEALDELCDAAIEVGRLRAVALVRTVLEKIPTRDSVYGDRDWEAIAADSDAIDAAIDALLAALTPSATDTSPRP